MKKITSILVAAALMMVLAGCNKTENPESSNDSTNTSSQTNATESTESTESTDSADSEPLSDDVKKLLEKYPNVAEYKGRDGEIMPLNKITNITYPDGFFPQVTYGLGYMTYGVPCFATTIGNDDWKSEGNGFSNTIDWLNYRIDEAEKSFTESKRFMVKPGDKLENGLVVKSAETVCEVLTPEEEKEWEGNGRTIPIFNSTKIEFDGELTLEGVLYKYEGDPQYFSVQNDVFFYLDTTKNDFVPMNHTIATTELLDSEGGVIHCGSYYLGNLGDIDDLPSVDYDVDEILGDKNYARVKLTLKNIYLDSSMNNSQSCQNAQIADAELLD